MAATPEATTMMAMREETVDEQAAQVAYAIHNTAKQTWPFAHLHLQNLLPPDLYRSVCDLDISRETLTARPYANPLTAAEQKRYSLGYVGADLVEGRVEVPELERLYRVLTHKMVTSALLSVFGREIQERYKGVAIKLDSAFIYVEDSTGYELLPHTDTDSKVVTLLIYLAREGDNPDLGTELYVPIDESLYEASFPSNSRHRREKFLVAYAAPFHANTALAFPPSKRTFHGVPPVSHGGRTRRLVQFQITARAAQKS